MSTIKYVKFDDIDPEGFIPVLNEEDIRGHLISHHLFDSQNIKEWVKEKIVCDAMPGCRIRGVYADDTLVGWCGIQQDDEHFEIAVVISKSVWGIGVSIFEALMCWSKELGHKEVVIHLLETRPVYKFLKRKAIKTHSTKMLGRNFVTYHISV
ncbi:MAG: hypothetical protein COB30_011890 [Ectothiorhodospiraceae bacterium]|nr:hypothetical protein [Ectothiorhodospiraceae bacterium]